MGGAVFQEPDVMYAHFFKMDPDFSTDDGQIMYTVVTKVNAIPPLGKRTYRYVVIPKDFWAGDKDPGSRLLTDEELYETLKLQHCRTEWRHVGYRSEKEPHILLFQYVDPPAYKSEEEKKAAQEEMDRKKAAQEEAERKKAAFEEEERKRKAPLEEYRNRQKRIYEELRKLVPTSFPTNEVPYRTVDEIGRLVIPDPKNPLETGLPEKTHKSYKRPRELNNHVKEWYIEKMKKTLSERQGASEENSTKESEENSTNASE